MTMSIRALTKSFGFLVTALSAALLVALPASAQVRLGGLTQLGGAAGCVVWDGHSPDIGDCDNAGRALDAATAVAVSPDGKNVYAAARDSDAIVAFERRDSGALQQLSGGVGCTVWDGHSPVIADCDNTGRALDGVTALAVTPDGKNVYAAARLSDAIVVFERLENGALRQLAGTAGCISRDGTAGACAVGRALDGVNSVAVSPDGENLYATSGRDSTDPPENDALLSFDRASEDLGFGTGALTQLSGAAGCVVWQGATAIAGCDNTGRGLMGARSVAVSPDGLNVYTAASTSKPPPDNTPVSSAAVFARGWQVDSGGPLADPGELDQLPEADVVEDGCVTGMSDHPDDCFRLPNPVDTNAARSVAAADDGKTIDFTTGSGVTTFARASDNPAGHLGLFEDRGRNVQIVGSSGAALVSPDGQSAYAAVGEEDALQAFERFPDHPDFPGALAQFIGPHGCIVDEPAADQEGLDATPCDNSGRALASVEGYGPDLAISPDGRNVYLASQTSDAVAVFDRSPQHAPVCLVPPVTAQRDVPVTIRLDCSDADGDHLTFKILSAPLHGTLSDVDHAAQTVTYTPDADFPRSGVAGEDSFRFSASDGTYLDLYATEATQTILFSAEPIVGQAGGVGAVAEQVGTVRIFGRALRLRRGLAKVALRCGAASEKAPCSGTLTLRTDRARNRKSGKRIRALALGRASYSIPAGATKRVKVRIAKAGRRLLNRQDRRRPWVWATALAAPRDGAAGSAASRSLVLLRA